MEEVQKMNTRPSHFFRPVKLIVLTSGNIFQQDGEKNRWPDDHTKNEAEISFCRSRIPDSLWYIWCFCLGSFVSVVLVQSWKEQLIEASVLYIMKIQ
jgi:hypothetical protein